MDDRDKIEPCVGMVNIFPGSVPVVVDHLEREGGWLVGLSTRATSMNEFVNQLEAVLIIINTLLVGLLQLQLRLLKSRYEKNTLTKGCIHSPLPHAISTVQTNDGCWRQDRTRFIERR